MTIKKALIITGILILIYLAAPAIHIKATDAGGMPSSTPAAPTTVLPPETTTTIDLSFLNTTTTSTTTYATPTPQPQPTPMSSDRWDILAQCETGGNWSTNTGSGFGGGLQFAHTSSWSTWRAYGGEEFATHPWDATREQQIAVAERVLATTGWKAWPGCSRKLGWI